MTHSSPTDRLVDAVAALSSDLSLPAILRRIVSSACDLADARYGALGVLRSGSRPDSRIELSAFITHGVDDAALLKRIGHYPQGHGMVGALIRDPRPMRLHDLTAHPAAVGFPPGHPPMRTFLGVPMRVRGVVFGNLYLTEKRDGGDFTEPDEELVVALAAAAGIAIENTRLHERTREFAVLADRERIARDLHDSVIQRLFATGLALQAVTRITEKPEVADRVQQAVDDLDATIRDIRGVIFALQAHERGEQSLRVLVLALAAEMQRSLGHEPRVHMDGPIDAAIDDVLAGDLLSVLREMLSNVAHHADATSTDVTLAAGAEIVLRVEDDGRGPGPGVREGGRGVANLAGRAASHGGSFSLRPRHPRGTVAEWRVPRKLPVG